MYFSGTRKKLTLLLSEQCCFLWSLRLLWHFSIDIFCNVDCRWQELISKSRKVEKQREFMQWKRRKHEKGDLFACHLDLFPRKKNLNQQKDYYYILRQEKRRDLDRLLASFLQTVFLIPFTSKKSHFISFGHLTYLHFPIYFPLNSFYSL